MTVLDSQLDRRPPVSPDTPLSQLADRFSEAPDRAALAVVEAGRPLGLAQRITVETLCRTGVSGLTARDVMDPAPILLDADRGQEAVRDAIAAARTDGPLFIAVRDGQFLGVGSITALEAERAQRSRMARDAAARLTQALTREVLAEIEGANTFLEALERQPLTADGAACVAALRACTGGIRQVMRRAGALHDGQTGLASLTPAATRLADVIEGLDARWSDRAAQAGVALLTSFDGPPDLAGLVDAERLGDIFDALIDRALHETARGAVEATLTIREAGEGLMLQGQVRDAGPASDPARLARIFDPLDSGSPLGVALGMADAAATIQQMNGVIHAEANPGAGATVTFEFMGPRAELADSPASQTAQASPVAHILIVDDNATNRMVAEALCEMFDCTSEQAVDGVEAVEAARIKPFDLILMDIKMPRMDGVAATRAIRALPGVSGQIPIVALTANADPADVRTYLAAGMNDVVEKPIKAELLLEVLDRVLSGEPPVDSQQARDAG